MRNEFPSLSVGCKIFLPSILFKFRQVYSIERPWRLFFKKGGVVFFHAILKDSVGHVIRYQVAVPTMSPVTRLGVCRVVSHRLGPKAD